MPAASLTTDESHGPIFNPYLSRRRRGISDSNWIFAIDTKHHENRLNESTQHAFVHLNRYERSFCSILSASLSIFHFHWNTSIK
ncbi:unnamed protein product [Fusarium graminearum]|uniref:Uncharacterized protein n=1 Tax=Gibberella zeae TaxID=5518 RepID=A0A4E9DX47_GIBZA|nr:unnamed protein product [Fusarium graminearum]CAF3610864.1 unnamed protein product [Fusarium graminearum]CAG1966500.1 unnamed protein product [Fusarium graminearum]CAG2000041.1 unnamed protein product [Fusarium graminearum]